MHPSVAATDDIPASSDGAHDWGVCGLTDTLGPRRAETLGDGKMVINSPSMLKMLGD